MIAEKTSNQSSSSSDKKKRKASDASSNSNPSSSNKKKKNDQSITTETKQQENDCKNCCEWPVTTFLFQAEYGFINQHYNPFIDTEDTEKIKSLKHLLSLFEKNYMPIVTKNSLINKNVVVSQSNYFPNDKLISSTLFREKEDEHPLTAIMIGRQQIRLLAPETTTKAYLCAYDLGENKKLSKSPNGGIRFNNWTVYPTKRSPLNKKLFATVNGNFYHKGQAIQRRLFWLTKNKSQFYTIHCLEPTIENFPYEIKREDRNALYEKKLWTEVENLPTKMITDVTLLDLRQDGVEHTGLEQIPENDTICSSEESVSMVVGSINNIEAQAGMPTKMISDGKTLLDLRQTGVEQDSLPFNSMQLQQLENSISICIENTSSIMNFQIQALSATNGVIENDDMDVGQSFLSYEDISTQSAAAIINQPVPNNVDETICETVVNHNDENGDENDDNNCKPSTNQHQTGLMTPSDEHSEMNKSMFLENLTESDKMSELMLLEKLLEEWEQL